MNALRLQEILYELIPREVLFFVSRPPAGFPSPTWTTSIAEVPTVRAG